MRDENRLTLWTRPDQIIKSGHGTITYREWCEHERERINRAGGNTELVTRLDGFVALFRVPHLPSCKMAGPRERVSGV